MSHSWHYMKSSMMGDTQEGPVDEPTFVALLESGKLKPSTLVFSPTRTKGQWVHVKAMPALMRKISEGRSKRKEGQPKQLMEVSPPVDIPMAQPPTIVETGPSSAAVFSPQGQPANIQVQVQGGGSSNSLGIASLVLGILSFFTCWLPFVGFAISGLGLLLGLIGIVLSLTRKGTGIGYGIAGSAVCFIGIVLGISFMIFIQGLADGLEQASQNLNQAVPAGGNFDPTVADNLDVFHPHDESLQLGHIKLSITDVRIGKVPLWSAIRETETESENEHLIIWLEVENTSDAKKINFSPWMNAYSFISSYSLTDENENRYRGVTFPATTRVKESAESESIYPGDSINAAIVFELPVDGIESLFLTLPGDNCDEDGEFKFRIPSSAIQR